MEEVQPKIQQSLPGPLLPGSNLALLCESLMTCVVQASSPESRGFKCDMSSVYVCVCMCMCVFQVCVIVQRRYLIFSRSYFLLIRILFLYIFVIFMCFLSPVLFGNPSRGAVSAFGVSNLDMASHRSWGSKFLMLLVGAWWIVKELNFVSPSTWSILTYEIV